MRKILAMFAGLAGAAVLMMPSASGTAVARHGHHVKVAIFPVTSRIMPFDPDQVFGQGDGGPGDHWSKSVRVYAPLRCGATTTYVRRISLTQDGTSYFWATAALGADEISCTAGDVVDAGMTFWGDGLHRGLAAVTVSVEDSQTTVAQRSSHVIIP